VTKPLTFKLGSATHIGGRDANADAVCLEQHDLGIGVAVVDGIGTNPEVCRAARRAADVAAIVASHRNAQAGIMAAADTMPDYADAPNAVAAVVSIEPDGRVEIAHIGDVAVWTVSDAHGLQRWTVDQVVGQHVLHLKKHTGLGDEGQAVLDESFANLDKLAETMNDYVLNGLKWATLATTSWTPLRPGYDEVELVVVASDGVSKALDDDQFATIVFENRKDPEAMTACLVNAAVETAARKNPVVLVDNATAAAVRFER
jgi:serine/threonine protein phosphatase PrpC